MQITTTLLSGRNGLFNLFKERIWKELSVAMMLRSVLHLGAQVSFIWRSFIVALSCSYALQAGCAAKHYKEQLYKEDLTNLRFPHEHFFPRDWKWVKEAWTGSDAPYVNIRRSIDVELAKNSQPKRLRERYQITAAANPFDPQAQYAWAYAAVMTREVGYYFGHRYLSDVSAALAQPRSPKTYEYARLRFIILMRHGTWLQMKPLALRLLQRNPQDYNVKVHLVPLMAIRGSVSDQQKALVLAKQLVDFQPRRASAWGALGGHIERFLMTERISLLETKP